MQSISLCMIVKDEENTLDQCLSSVKDIADEIVIVDTGSKDRTKEIASKYTNRIYDFRWVNDFSSARNFSFRQASMDYILWLDADDVILAADQEGFKQLKEGLDPSVDCVMMKYNTGFDAAGKVIFSYYRERLVKRSRGFVWKEPVHEYLEVSGKIINSEVSVTHTKLHSEPSSRNLTIYEQTLARNKELSPRGMYYYARELKENGRHLDAIRYFSLFLDTEKGWKEDNIRACLDLAACYEHEQQPQWQHFALLRSFIYDTPRAELCCALGYFYKSNADYRQAAFWFKLAATTEKPEDCWGFIQEEYWGYIPLMELVVCYDRLGKTELAQTYHEAAAKLKPDDPAVEYNRKYFDSLKDNKKI